MRRVDSRRILNRPRLCHLSLFGVNEVLFVELADTLSNWSAYLCVIVIFFSSFCQHNRHTTQPDCVTLCPLYSGCGRTLFLLCAAVGCRLTNYQALHAMKLSCYAENVAFT